MEKKYRVNRQIRAREVRVIDENGQNLGIMPIKEALALAEEKGLDLIEIAPTAKPPVCKLGDFGKFKSQESEKVRFLFLGRIGNNKGIFDVLNCITDNFEIFEGRIQIFVAGDGEIDKFIICSGV